MKFVVQLLIFFLSFFSLQAQTFVESFLKNKDSITIYHNGKGQEMIPVVRFYLFDDNIVPDTSGRIDADHLLSQWNQYLLGKTTSIYDMYRQKKPSTLDLLSLRTTYQKRRELEERYPAHPLEFPEPDFIVQPCIVCYAPEDETRWFCLGLENDAINHILESKCSDASFPKKKPKDRINHILESKYSPCRFEERKVICLDLCVGGKKWFLKGDTLYTGYVWESDSNRMRLRTVQETLDDISLEAIHYLNSIDSTCLIPAEKRQKIARILDDEIIFHYHQMIDNGGFCGVYLNSKEFIAIFGHRLVPCEEAFRRRGEKNQYYGPISYRRLPTKK